MKKRRKDAKLWNLPTPVQAQLYDIASGPGSYPAARAWLLKEHGLEVKSDATVSSWWAAYPFSLPAAAAFATTFEAEIKKLPDMEGQAEKISRLGQVGFEVMAMRSQNLKGYSTLKKLRLKEREITLAESKHEKELREEKAKNEAAKNALEKARTKGGLSPETLKLIEEQLAIL